MKRLVLLFLLGLSTSVFAQQRDTIPQQLSEVVVTATRSEIQLENSPIPTEVIGKDEIEKLNLNTMDDLLKQKGFFVAPLKSGGFQLRGLTSEYVLVMIDGVPFEGAGITSQAFAQYIPFSDVFLTIAVVLFAVSTMISWSYYGLQSWKFLFGRGKAADLTYKLLFCLFIVIGAAASMNSIWAFSDAMIFAMVFPNMIGLYFLFPVVKEQLNKYLKVIKQ